MGIGATTRGVGRGCEVSLIDSCDATPTRAALAAVERCGECGVRLRARRVAIQSCIPYECRCVKNLFDR